jgi:UDP-glucose 4-epimerase
MKKNILITGANSYVGTNVEKWLLKEPNKYHVETLDMENPNWNEFDFSKFQVVFHVAGIAHVSAKKSMRDLYFKINKDLAIETAKKAKLSGVKQFIFMSSMIVYSSKAKKITRETKPNPDNFYGLSKLLAEQEIILLQSNDFRICILRPPMIYGPGAKGNFLKLIKFAKKTPVFPNYSNKRSMLYIGNLNKYIEYIINENIIGVIFPRNINPVSTVEVINYYSTMYNHKIIMTKIFNPLIRLFKNRILKINKVFGDYFYDIEEDISISQIELTETLRKTAQMSTNNEN